MHRLILFVAVLLMCHAAKAQQLVINGSVKRMAGDPLATISMTEQKRTISTDSLGNFSFVGLMPGVYQLKISLLGYRSLNVKVNLEKDTTLLQIMLEPLDERLNEVVITGTQKEVNRLESPVPVEIYTAKFFKKNPTPSIFEALQNVNGVRPQLNCNICNTGDIHINGLEGPYTMVLIDGMPIVSSLSTVYGLSGIPNALVERIEVVKGPASSLYGSEAVGGLINIITKKVEHAGSLSADVMSTGYGEHNTDIGFKVNLNQKIAILTGLNYFKYGNKVDHNHDGFTDVTLQDRISVFQKWSISRKQGRVFSLAGRYLYEDRWGGEMNWTKTFRGGDIRYGESIYTKRMELIGNYQLPVNEKMFLSFSLTDHQQDSRYGTTAYIAKQQIAFSQLTWDKKMGNNDLLFGAAFRYTYYDDNTPATAGADLSNPSNNPERTLLPGLFIQDEIKLSERHSVLAGLRFDYNSTHGNIFTPRFAYKWALDQNNIIRLNAGTGFRVVNIFTEDHAALTGARQIIIENELKPERTYNVNLNYLKKVHLNNGSFLGLDFSGFYTYFNNRIIGDFDSNPNQLIYNNLDGYAVSKGLTANVDMAFSSGLKITTGLTYQDVGFVSEGVKQQQILTEKLSGTWAVSYKINKLNLGIDYTGNIYGPMRLPLLGKMDPRRAYSPVWSIQNIQLVYDGFRRMELYGGVKNLLNFTPNKGTPFLIAGANDPFDKNVQYDTNGQVMATSNNPYGLTFDPNYIYAPNQGIRVFFGVRLLIK
ncbi:TonB-dependent receptor [Pedobacter insulae]|uniref:Outer membrane receptor for ferrienterochelin and colicins n=1 Tax=Pedobacter insulae TaxID=414048 RepID=A0A1I2UJC7_9SPHI|nr:TonB-dependent receptor [Pedobacter insulae]SFG77262.1 outer membrane receptor for ferrienterochelin and colicins [Pedobacter insulae]